MKKIILGLFVFSFLLVGFNVYATETEEEKEVENVCCEIYGIGSMGVKTPSTHKMTPKNECLVMIPGGGRKIVDNSFCVSTLPVENTPVISGVKGPQTLKVGQKGEWEIKASAPMGSSLTYEVVWGDEAACTQAPCPQAARSVQQTATFTHFYKGDGTYNPKFIVKSENTIRCVTTPCPSNAGSASTSISVVVNNITNVCPLILLNCEKGYSQVNSGKDSKGCDIDTCKKDLKRDESCLPGYKFSPKTGAVCPTVPFKDGCMPGYKFSPMTGAICPINVYDKDDDKNEDKKIKIKKTCTEPGSNCGVRNHGISRVLKHGTKGDDVKVLQSLLNLIEDGVFGPETKTKLIEWQKEHDLTADGVLGPKSLEKIEVEIELED